MERLTTDKAVKNMDMVELAHNCCYAKDRKAMYQDRAFDTDARAFARHVMKLQAGIELPLDDEEFDERMHDFLWYDPATSVVGTVALLYRNLWAMADLRETLKVYEDAEEQGSLLRLPVPLGTIVYNTTWWDSIEDCVKVNGKAYFRTERKYKVSKSKFSLLDIEEFGKTVFLTKEAESALAEKGGVE